LRYKIKNKKRRVLMKSLVNKKFLVSVIVVAAVVIVGSLGYMLIFKNQSPTTTNASALINFQEQSANSISKSGGPISGYKVPIKSDRKTISISEAGFNLELVTEFVPASEDGSALLVTKIKNNSDRLLEFNYGIPGAFSFYTIYQNKNGSITTRKLYYLMMAAGKEENIQSIIPTNAKTYEIYLLYNK
jgi:hypothetical protein